MYAGTGISTDSARRKKSKRWARWTAKQCKKLFQARPMPELESPKWEIGLPTLAQPAFEGVNGQAVSSTFVTISRDDSFRSPKSNRDSDLARARLGCPILNAHFAFRVDSTIPAPPGQFAPTELRLIRIDLVSPVIDRQHGRATDSDLGFAAALLGQPEVSRLRIRISNHCPRNQERGIFSPATPRLLLPRSPSHPPRPCLDTRICSLSAAQH